MPGRPRKMAQRVARLSNQLLDLADELLCIMPKQYFANSSGGPDPLGLGDAWSSADETVTEAALAVAHLADVLQDRAGIVKPRAGNATEPLGESGPDTDETIVAS